MHTAKEDAYYLTHQVPTDVKKCRIADYCKDLFLTYPSKTSIKKAIKKNLVLVDGKIATTAHWIQGGETISIKVPERQGVKILDLSLNILYEDDYIAAIDKPAGLLVSGHQRITLANALPQNLKKSQALDACTPWPVHRLDYGTTGVLLVAKTSTSLRALSEQFASSDIKKTYHAIVMGAIPKFGEIKTPIDSKPSHTTFKLIRSLSSDRFERLNLVSLKPNTGRRHQLRKHMAEIGHPILGDQQYGQPDRILKGHGIYLHASRVNFKHPVTAKSIEIDSPIPKKFSQLLNNPKGHESS